MLQGTMIDELINAVARAEAKASTQQEELPASYEYEYVSEQVFAGVA